MVKVMMDQRKMKMAVIDVKNNGRPQWAYRFFAAVMAATLLVLTIPYQARADVTASAGVGSVLDGTSQIGNGDKKSEPAQQSTQAAKSSEVIVTDVDASVANTKAAETAEPDTSVEAVSQKKADELLDTTNGSSAANSSSGSNTTTKKEKTLEQLKKEAKKEIGDYGDIKKLKAPDLADQIDKAVKQFKGLIGTANGNKNTDGLKTESSIDDCIAEAKETIDSIAAKSQEGSDASESNTQPSSTSDFIMVGGSWVTPQVSYGQNVAVVLPVVNMSATNLTNVTVTPVISNSTSEWPFVIDTSNYTQTIPDLPGKGNGQDDMERRRELTWYFTARSDALSGYYKLQFNVLYANGGETESATLTTYVKVNGAPGSGNIENEGGGTSTPRVIVTGFETDPAKVHAGDQFTLILHLKNTSQRTKVSNMLVNLSAPNEGLDSDSSYAVFLPVSGSNSIYVANIGKGQTADVAVDLKAKADLSHKPYQLDISMEYEDDTYASFTSNADISIPIEQEARFELSKAEILPDQIEVDGESNIMFSIYNLGKITLYNVKVSFEGDCISGGEAFLGKIEAGGTGNVDVTVTGEKGSEEGQKPKVVITYEDDAGNQSEYKEEIDLTVTGGMSEKEKLDADQAAYYEINGDEDDDDYYDEIDVEDQTQSGVRKVLPFVFAGIGVIAVVVIILALISKAKKRKEEKEDLELLDELKEKDDEIP